MNIPQILSIFCGCVIVFYYVPVIVCGLSTRMEWQDQGLAFKKAWAWPCAFAVLGATLLSVFLEVLSSYHFM